MGEWVGEWVNGWIYGFEKCRRHTRYTVAFVFLEQENADENTSFRGKKPIHS